jgi:predicted dehydrogenase
MLKVGIVGTGNMGRTHAAGWARTPATIAAFCSLDARAPEAAEQYNAALVDNLDSLLPQVDVVDICAPTHLHHEMVLAAAAAGKHIVCEKPLALTYAQGCEVLAACQRAGVTLLVAHVVRFFPEYAAAKAIIERGDIGAVAVTRLTRCAYQPKAAADNWFLDPTRSGGMMLDLMIHDFDYARWIAGDVVSVYARSVRGSQPDAAEDYAIAVLSHASGAISNIEGAWAYPPPMFRTALEIAGSGGLIEHPADSSVPLGIYLKRSSTGETADVGIPGSPLAEDPYTTEIKHFYDVLVHNVAARVTAEDGLAALRIALAARQSAQSGQAVMIEEIE